MPVILTVTPNPALDISTSVDRIQPGPKLRCSGASRNPGGGGINVARVARRLGADARALYTMGGCTGDELETLVRRDHVQSLPIRIAGPTRENFTVLDEHSREEFRFVLPGPRLRDPDWMECLKMLGAVEGKLDYICASGSLPRGAPADFYARVAEIAELKGVPFALDTSGPALRSALRERVRLVKPNLAELRELVSGALDDDHSLIAACRWMIAEGRTEMVALTLGGDGALLVTSQEAWRSPALPIAPLSTVGAGDSFLGAMVWALALAMPVEEAFRYGCAAGAAALLAPGTELCRPGDVRRLLNDVQVDQVASPAHATG